jgi:hypothetical protein
VGAAGAQGPAGVPGFDGDDAENLIIVGPAGATGATGAEGAIGPQGPQGPAVGLVTEDGEDAPLFIARGQDGQAGAQGDPGAQGPQGPPGLPGTDGEDAELILVPGPQGPQGATGDTGAPGSGGGSGQTVVLPSEEHDHEETVPSLIMPEYDMPVSVMDDSIIGGWVLPGVVPQLCEGNVTIGNGAIRYYPIWVASTIVFDTLHFQISSFTSNKDYRVGVYVADKNWQPKNLIYGSGIITATAVGAYTATPASPIALPRGMYLLAIRGSTTGAANNGAVQGFVPGITPVINSDTASQGMAWYRDFSVSEAMAAFADPGTPWDATNKDVSDSHARYTVFMHLSDF